MTGTDSYTGVVLAAGRGSRLGSLTDDRPKCLVELAGRPLLRWQLSALEDAGIGDLAVVTGYRRELIEAHGVRTVHNPRWQATNMVGTLLCAFDALDGPFVVSYSDIVYDARHVSALLEAEGDVVITYDTRWLDLWSRRFDDPLSDAERFQLADDGAVAVIGGTAESLDQIGGQFMGLLRISQKAVETIRSLVAGLADGGDTLDTTSLLSSLIRAGARVDAVAVSGAWCEVDDQADLEVAEELMAAGAIMGRV